MIRASETCGITVNSLTFMFLESEKRKRSENKNYLNNAWNFANLGKDKNL